MKLIEDIGIHKRAWHNQPYRYGQFRCPVCKEIVEKILKDGLKAQFCSHKCYSKKRKKRGPYVKRIISKKYIYLYMPEHPNARGTKKLYVSEHRLEMETHIGRYLNGNEIVHHKNGDTMDNDIDNLQIMTASEHVKHHKKKARRAKDGQFKV